MCSRHFDIQEEDMNLSQASEIHLTGGGLSITLTDESLDGVNGGSDRNI